MNKNLCMVVGGGNELEKVGARWWEIVKMLLVRARNI